MGDPGSIPWSGRSPGEGNGNLLQSSCRTEEPGGLQSIESLSHTWLSNFTSRWGPIRVVSESRSVVSDSLWPHGLPGFPVCHQLPELTQTHALWVGDAIQPSHPLLSPFPPTFNPSQHQGLFEWVSSSHQVTKVLEFQHQSFQWLFRTDFL